MSGFHVLFVCLGNICRSPLGERLLAAKLPSGDFVVRSAGVRAMTGRPMDADAAAQLRALGGDPEGFVARQVTDRMLADADLVLAATRPIRSRVLEENPAVLKRAFTVLEFAALIADLPELPLAELVAEAARQRSRLLTAYDVPDPYGRGVQAHREAAALIANAVDTIAERLARAAAAEG